jgi:hypothetical protein
MESAMTKINASYRLLLALVAATVGTSVWAQEAAKPAVNSQIRQAEATVQTIDPATREVSLRGPRGSFIVVVSPEVKNLDKVQVGDKVVVSYYEGVAAQMAKGATKATDPAESDFKTPGQSNARPGGGRGTSVTTRVIIEDVDPGTNTVAFKRSDGTVHIIAVKSPKMQQFIRTLKRGDAVDVTYTESVAVDVVPSMG